MHRTMQKIGIPSSIRGSFSGTAATFVESLCSEPILILAALAAVYIVLIGVILLIGIVKKNAILTIDFALQAERGGMDAREAIRTACMMTIAAAAGALPLALGVGEGAELRQPLGISIVGGLLASQLLTLYTTPVVYIHLDDFRAWLVGQSRQFRRAAPSSS
jgi:multidrug efflux pump